MNSQDDELVMIYGTRAVIEALSSGKEIERVFLQNGLNNPLIRELKEALEGCRIAFSRCAL
jgi:23S rRNA (guanosine2251-2'-O)-methyltransferase